MDNKIKDYLPALNNEELLSFYKSLMGCEKTSTSLSTEFVKIINLWGWQTSDVVKKNYNKLAIIKDYIGGVITSEQYENLFKIFSHGPFYEEVTDKSGKVISKIKLPLHQNLTTHDIDRTFLEEHGIKKIDPIITRAFKNFYTYSDLAKKYSTNLAIGLQRIFDADESGLIKKILAIQPEIGITFLDPDFVYSRGGKVNGFNWSFDTVVKWSNESLGKVLGTILHEHTHKVMRVIFKNSADPYESDSTEAFAELQKLRSEMFVSVFKKTFTYDSSEYDREFIAFFIDQLTQDLYNRAHGIERAIVPTNPLVIDSEAYKAWVKKYVEPKITEAYIKEYPNVKNQVIIESATSNWTMKTAKYMENFINFEPLQQLKLQLQSMETFEATVIGELAAEHSTEAALIMT